MIDDFVNFDDEQPSQPIRLRGRQPQWVEAIESDMTRYSRMLVVAPGGCGKTTVFAALASRFWRLRGLRTLILENRDRLTEQTAERIRVETGLEVAVEKGDQRADPHSPIVVGCVQSLSKRDRLTCFSDAHFGLVVPDECHLAINPSWLRVLNYFHYGSESLSDGWIKPDDGMFIPKSYMVGFTASPDLGDKRNLGAIFHRQSVNYSYLEAIEEGWLVGIKEVNVPVRIDTRKFHVKRTSEGNAFSVEDQNRVLIPIIHELAKQIVTYASDKKGMCFVPSVQVARLMAEELRIMGIPAEFVSGECIDKNEKTDRFAESKRMWLVNCTIYTFGVDFPDVDCVAIFGAMLSKVKYIQSVYRGTRVLPGLVHDGMTTAERLHAIARSAKPHLLLLSPFYISDRIDICEPFDLFGIKPETARKVRPLTDFTDPSKIRDYIKILEKAADKHAHKQERTIDPVKFALNVGDGALAHYTPETSAEAVPASRDELDWLLEHDIDTTQIKTSGQAQRLIARMRERERLGLATPKQLDFLRKLTKRDDTGRIMPAFPEDWVITLKKSQASAIIGRKTEQWRGVS